MRSWVEDFLSAIKFLRNSVDLFVRSWVEDRSIRSDRGIPVGRPLREVVSWRNSSTSFLIHFLVDLFVRSWVEEANSHILALYTHCRPLREVVSWRDSAEISYSFETVDLFVRSWVEESYLERGAYSAIVDLFVRSWVEDIQLQSPPLGERVDLFVRSWVEEELIISGLPMEKSTSSWGRELKKYTGR